ncbi:PREDICTED: uncharacterized protein LOC109208846 [Nicotiana attenuata]|uniref:uncharacterized protein LOC109208846 n=1 Tax=Nicotiana attenuata TaxID=49451 RepID=UPI0009053E8A|nr:PREDICTED: uncharacterized protein LOC109208846 [Nicotiana attenuata]
MDQNKNKYHWASWQKLAKPMEEGGVGFRAIEDVCRSLEFKQWWWFRTKDSLWSRFLNAKYCQRSHPISKTWNSGQSQAWKRMMYNKKEADVHIQWRLHSGNSSFWWDNWLGTGHLASHRMQGGRPGKIHVSYFWNSGSWDVQKLNSVAPPHMIPAILQTPIAYNPQLPDRPIWKPTTTGNSTCSSAWNVVREKGPLLFINRKIWNKKIPFKWSFCMWRALRNKLPTDDRVARFGPPIVTKCVCCIRTQAESIDHIFSRGHFAKAIWKIFTSPVGFPFAEMPLNTLLMKWWICATKYGSKQSSMTRVVFSINSDINLMLKAHYPTLGWPPDWNTLYPLSENLQFQTKITQVTWQKPIPGFVKVNSDGSALTNPGKIGAGAIIRNHHGDLINAIASPIGEGSNNLAETEAAFLGVKWCIDSGFTKIHLEADSALLIHCLTTDSSPPWTLTISIQKLKHICQQSESITFTHAYREANTPTDSLSKISHTLNSATHFSYLNDLPIHIRGQVCLDKMGIPAFRHKLTRKLRDPNLSLPSASNRYG